MNVEDMGGFELDDVMYASLPVIAHIWDVAVEQAIRRLHGGELHTLIIENKIMIRVDDLFAELGKVNTAQWN